MRRRQAHRAADVGAEVQRPVARGRRRAGAGAGARRVALEAPRIARDAVQAGQARGQHAVVGHGGLAEDHAAGLAQRAAGGASSVCGGASRWRACRSAPDRPRVDVLLDGDRHAVERRERLAFAPARLAARACSGAVASMRYIALSFGSHASMRASSARAASTGESSPRRKGGQLGRRPLVNAGLMARLYTAPPCCGARS